MPKRFAGIRLLLIFVAINTVMFLMLVASMTSSHPWLAHVLPGQFETGVNSSGYWVFFALVLLVNAVTVLIAGLVLVLPVMWDGASADERRLMRHLSDRGGVAEEAKEAVLAALREEAAGAQHQIVVGRSILMAGAVFLVIAFFAVTLSYARAMPDGEMFGNQAYGEVQKNATVSADAVGQFTMDQLAGAVLLDAPEIYDWHVGSLVNNPRNVLFTNFVFAFRTAVGFVLLLTVLSFLFGAKPKREEKPVESAAATPEEKST